MSDRNDLSTTREVAQMMGVSDAVARDWAPSLSLESISKARVPRGWTRLDVAQLLTAQALTTRGFSVRVALSMTRAMAAHFAPIIRDGAKAWLVAWPVDGGSQDWNFEVVTDPSVALAKIQETSTTVVLDVEGHLSDALQRIAAFQAERDR